ncbi:MAG: DUF5956 family protein [Nocardioides sp.]
MATVDWGVEAAPLRLPGLPHGWLAPIEADDPWQLPAVQAAHEQGFEPAPEAPLWTFLPAAWPDSARAWIPDTRVRHLQMSCNEEPWRTAPWSTADYFELEADANRLLADCGLPPRPPGRLWLLKPPEGFVSLDATLGRLLKSAEDSGLLVTADRAFVQQVLRDLDGLFASGS